MSGFLLGLKAPWRGMRLVWQPGLRRYVLIPLTINALLFAAAMLWLTDLLGSSLRDWLPEWLAGVIYPVLALALGILTLLLTSLIANLLASPFNVRLAQRMETLLGQPPSTLERPLWQDTLLTVRSEARRFLHFLFWVVVLLILGFIPLLNLLTPFAWLALGAWLMTLQYLDYPLGLRGHDFSAQRRLLARHPGFSLGFGLSAQLMHLLPGPNLFAMPASVVAACAAWRKQEGMYKRQKNMIE